MDRLKKLRKSLRTMGTKTIHDVETELAKDDHDLNELLAKMQRLETILAEMNDIDAQIKDLMLEADCTDEDLELEMTNMEGHPHRIRLCKVRIEKVLYPQVNPDTAPSHHSFETAHVTPPKTTLRLPKIDIKKFSGQAIGWLSFWAQFRKLHEDPNIEPEDKFQYLMQSMVDGSRAQKLVERFQQTAANYPKVIAALQERYGNRNVLQEMYVREMLKMVVRNAKTRDKVDIAQMYDELESHLGALESLGVTTEQTAAFLYPMVESSLPEEILSAWLRSSNYGKDGSVEQPPRTPLDYMMQFLRAEVEGEDKKSRARSGFGELTDSSKGQDSEKKKNSRRNQSKDAESVATAAGLHVAQGQSSGCIFCGKSHSSQDCFKAMDLGKDEKMKVLSQKKACFACLRPGHQSKGCKSQVKCSLCTKKHYVLMCPENPKNQKSKDLTSFSKPESTAVNTNRVQSGSRILGTFLVKLAKPGVDLTLRVLLDPASEGSYIRKKVATSSNCLARGSYWETNTVFGGIEMQKEKRTMYEVPIQSMDGRIRRKLTIPDKPRIAGGIQSLPNGPWMDEIRDRNIHLTEDNSDRQEIDILIGVDLLADFITERVVRLRSGLVAFETVFGWTIAGRLPGGGVTGSTATSVTTLMMAQASVSQLWELDVLGIRDPAESKSRVIIDEEVKRHFLTNVKREENGRYVVSLPWVGGVQEIPNNHAMATKRLQSTTHRLKRDNLFEDYDKLFKQWESEGFIEEVNEPEVLHCHYLPHRAVHKPESLTTPVRPVFDASCKAGRSPSLNDCLEKGPNLIELIPSIMHRFREGQIGAVADVRKAFQMIGVCKSDREYLRFLWWDDKKCSKLKVYRHRRVVFGVNCSPYLLGAVIDHHLSQYFVERPQDHDVSETLRRSFYVDNCIVSFNTMEEYHKFKETAVTIMLQAQMDLRQWEFGPVERSRVGLSSGCRLDLGRAISNTELLSAISNSSSDVTSPQPLTDPFKTMVLGMKWDKVNDTLRCGVVAEVPEKLTKRSLLSTVQKVFDPMGFLSPATLLPKLLLQETWMSKLGWDEELPEDILQKFKKWSEELSCLEEIRIPRNMTGGEFVRDKWQIHVFSDASQYAYATCVFLRVSCEGHVSVQLLQSKARVAPLKKMTIPRLELMSCSIAARLASSVKDALRLNDIPTFFWSDSSTALAWIKRNDEWGTFVGNRVREICTLTRPVDWRHVPGIFNPADLPSRGCSPQQLLRLRWWEGPSWLKSPKEEWPMEDVQEDESVIAVEGRKTLLKVLVSGTCDSKLWFVDRISSYSKCIRVLAWIKRLSARIRKVKVEAGQLTVHEVSLAERSLWQIVQGEVFPSHQDVIGGLHVIRGVDNLVYVKTRLLYRKDSTEFRLPILLPHSHPLVDRLIREEHLRNGHAGTQFLMGKLRESYWIIQTRKAIRKIVHSCVRCRRFTAKTPLVPVAPLPEDRVKDAGVFEVTGVDLAGPLYLKDKSKTWFVLFTCAVYRAIHLELVTSLSTEAFMLALFRFISRRGRPSVIYSDNGTNFVGTNNLFKTLDWRRIERQSGLHRIQWKFNPPSAAWWGGWWERLIRTIKDLVKRMLGHGKLSYIQLETCLCEVEAVVNGRPLTYVTEDSCDLVPLTPAMFLGVLQVNGLPEVKALDADVFRERYRDLVQFKEEIRLRFRSEYLGQLVQRGQSKKFRTFQAGEVVLVGSDSKKRLLWPMAKIIDLLPGKDGRVRVARVKTTSGELVRPLQRLYPLEVNSISPCVPISEEVKDHAKAIKAKEASDPISRVTRSGRITRRPARFSD